MKVTPTMIARALIEATSMRGADADALCDAALLCLKKRCPSFSIRAFIKLLDRELRRSGVPRAGMLVLPSDQSNVAEHIQESLRARAEKPQHIDRTVDTELIGGAVLLLDHRRLDCSVRGALEHLRSLCLAPLH